MGTFLAARLTGFGGSGDDILAPMAICEPFGVSPFYDYMVYIISSLD